VSLILSFPSNRQHRGEYRGSDSHPFVLNKPEYLLAMYSDMVEVWDRLGIEWQHHVRAIKQYHMHKIQQEEEG
jgi:hypothetical protein